MQAESVNWELIWVVPGLSLGGFLFHAFFGKALIKVLGEKAGKRLIGAVASLVVLGGFLISLWLFQNLLRLPSEERHLVQTLTDWIRFGTLNIPFEFVIDPLSILMCLIVTGVGGLIHLYATGYMAEDEDYPRFFTYFNLFIVFMLTLVLANNFVLMFIGWEGVGLCSYLLIGYWYRRHDWKYNTDSANKAFIVNRIGDWGFALALFLIFTVFGTFSFDRVFSEAPQKLAVNSGLAVAIALLLFLGATGKSAQLPLYFWLPDAMAGPTPVSALIHAATMVTAGVYMVARCHVLFELAPYAMAWVAGIGAFTALFAATIAVAQTDIKKVLAYSTVSQLGYMFLACGVGAFWAGMFHVTTHAFFKALLFLGSGSVILALHHEQDMRRMGGLQRYLPLTFLTMTIGTLAIGGIYPLSGFWSKDEILAKTYGAQFLEVHTLLFYIGLATAALTAFYMTRLLALTFFGQPRWAVSTAHGGHGKDEGAHHHEEGHGGVPREGSFVIWGVLVILAVLSIVGGWLYPTKHQFEQFLEPVTHASRLTEEQLGTLTHELEQKLIFGSLAAAGLGILIGLAVYLRRIPKLEESKFWRVLYYQWGYDPAMYRLGVRLGGRGASWLKSFFDERIVDGLLVNGTAWVVRWLGSSLRRVQTGYVRSYAFTMLLGVVIILTILFLLGRGVL